MTMHRHDNQVTLDASLASVAACQGRLTLESGVPISTTDQLAKTTVYFTPYNGNRISLYSGSVWNERVFAETSLDISAFTASKNYDIFGYDNSGTLALEGLVWTNDTTRATALALQDGIEVKSGAATRRYLGTIRTTATAGQTALVFGFTPAAGGSNPQCLVQNRYNKVPMTFAILDSTDSWNWGPNPGAYHQKNASVLNRFDFVTDGITPLVAIDNMCSQADNVNAGRINAFGLDSTTAIALGCATGYAGAVVNVTLGSVSSYMGAPAAGFHYLATLEYGNNTGTNVFYGDLGVPTILQTGASILFFA